MTTRRDRQPVIGVKDMRLEGRARAVQRTIGKCCNDKVMFADDPSDVLNAAAVQGQRDALVIAKPLVGVDHQGVAGQSDKDFMELCVVRDEALKIREAFAIVLGANAVIDHLKGRDDGGRDRIHPKLQRAKFHNKTRFEKMRNLVGIRGRRDAKTLVRLVGYKAFRRQPRQGFAQRDHAGAEFIGKLQQHNLFTLAQLAHHDPAMDFVMRQGDQVRLPQGGRVGLAVVSGGGLF